MTLDKLSGIWDDLVRTDPDWESCYFANLCEALRQWVKRNPVEEGGKRKCEERKRLLWAQREGSRPRGCVYCGNSGHKATQCEKVTEPNELKHILSSKGLCFNCAISVRRGADCPSKTACGHCSKRHHTSICDKKIAKNDENSNGAKLLMDGVSGDNVFAVVVMHVNGMMCRALIDSGAWSSYASAQLINTLKIRPREIKRQWIDMLKTSKTANMELYDVKITSVDGNHKMNIRLSKVEKGELLSISNPGYEQLIKRYQHLQSVKMDDRDTKKELPIHLVLGSGEFARIKTNTRPLVGKEHEPIAKKTKLGWYMMRPGVEFDKTTMLLTQTSRADFEKLCRLDVLGLADTSEHDQSTVYEDFKENLTCDPAG